MGVSAQQLVLGTRKGLLLFQRNGRGWEFERDAHLGISVPYSQLDTRTGILWACLDHGHWGPKLARSRDFGETWEEISYPKYPDGAELADGSPAGTRYLWVLSPGGEDEPQRLYIGTEPGGLFVSEDGGESFHLIEGLWNHPSRKSHWFGGGRDMPGIHSIVVDPRDSRHLLVGISCAGVFETTDGGATWEPRNAGLRADFLPDPRAEVGHDPHFLTDCAAHPDVLWQQNHCGIFRSADGGRSWQDISEPGGPAFFGFAIATDPNDPQAAWVVPALSDETRVSRDQALCVCRTENGGRTWQTLRTGLPQSYCYDLVFRHALALSGDTLAFGSTTGNVFVSEDRGETWSCLGHHFPPVYSVRFA